MRSSIVGAMTGEVLDGHELCNYFESMSEGRRELVWRRCEKLLGEPLSEFEDDDERPDEAFDAVVTDMWCSDQLDRLVALGRLQREIAADGSLMYTSPHLTG